MRLFFWFVFIVAALANGFPAWAVELTESIQVHGFIGQGYLYSSGNNFLADSEGGTAEFTDMGMNVNWEIIDNLRAGGQLFYRNLGNYSEDIVSIDWALLDYQPYDFLGLRLGKIKMPMGLYNESRDTDFLLPMVFLPQSVYDESRRDTYLSFIGAGIYGNVDMASWGDCDYHFFGGRIDFPEDSIQLSSSEDSVLSNVARNNALPLARRDPDIPSYFDSLERKSDHVYGAALVYSPALVDGLRLGGSWLHAKDEIFINGSSVPTGETVIHGKFVLSAEYSWRDFVFISEYNETDRTSSMFGKTSRDGPSQAWYLMVSYSPLERLTLSVFYDEFYSMKNDKEGTSRTNVVNPSAWRKDIAVGARYQLNENWVAKVEYHLVDGAAMQLGFLNADGAERYWNYFAGKIAFNF